MISLEPTAPHLAAHLEAVRPVVNVLRSRAFTAVNAAKTHCPQGHEYTASKRERICRTCRNAANARGYRRRRNKSRVDLPGGFHLG